MMTHDYNRAVKYYETRLKEDPKLLDIRTDLAELYNRLKVFEEAKRVLIDALKFIKSQDSFNSLDMKIRNVKYLVLLAKVYLDQDMQSSDWKFKDNQLCLQLWIIRMDLENFFANINCVDEAIGL